MSTGLLVIYIDGVHSLFAKMKHPSRWVFAKVRLDYLIKNFKLCLSLSIIGDYGVINVCTMLLFFLLDMDFKDFKGILV